MTSKEDTKYFRKPIYTLKSSIVPEIQNNVIRKNGQAGGIKLVYKTKTFIVRKCKIKHFTFYIRTSINALKKTKIYLRPSKEHWNDKRYHLSKNDWGKKNHPLTNLWLEMEFNWNDIIKEHPLMKENITDHKFRALLQKQNNFLFLSI